MPTEQSSTQSPWMRRIEAAQRLRISCSQIDQLANEGKIKKYRIGAAVLFKAEELDAAVELVTAANAGRQFPRAAA